MIKQFTIKKGSHYSLKYGFIPHFGITFNDFIEKDIMFDQSCLYEFENDIYKDIYDINKLIGLSTAYSHHTQSARIGWRCLDKQNIELLTYSYDKGVRQEAILLGNVKPNEQFTIRIEIHDKNFSFSFYKKGYDKQVLVKKSETLSNIKYLLYPFFGGNKSAPHDMKIYFK